MMNRRNIPSLFAITALGLALLPAGAVAQQLQHVSFKTPAANSKVTQGLNLDVGDATNHIVRVFEVHRTYPDDPPIINGLKLIEEWGRGAADLTDGNGSSTVYGVYVMENGDKFFARSTSVVQAASGKLTTTQVGFIIGGTGKLAGMRGVVRDSTSFDLNGFNENQTDIDYSIGNGRLAAE